MSSVPRTYLTPEEYLAIERAAETKSEYFRGEMFALAGAGRLHNLLVARLIRVLGPEADRRGCLVYPSDLRVKITSLGKYTYPDVTVTCGREEFEDDHSDTLLNPSVIFEILSESTEGLRRVSPWSSSNSSRPQVTVTSGYVYLPSGAIFTRRSLG